MRARDVDFRILGPLEVDVGGSPVDLGGPRQRAVLAVLVCHAARSVPAERLIDLVWGEQPPPGVQSTLQAYVSTLRRAIEPDRDPRAAPTLIVTRGGGYALDVATEQVDARRFESLAATGRKLLADRPDRARDVLTDALALWRGDALSDLVDLPFAQAESSRLGEVRALALENLVEARLQLGEHEAVVGDVEHLVRSHPYRERLWALLMLALYRSGRQAEALGSYRQARELLRDELGIDPGPELQRLESDILNQSAVLDWRPLPEAIDSVSVPDRPLVGRDPELALLERTLRETLARRGRVLLVFGEAGIGKTRLVEALDDRARRVGADVAWGRCIEGDAAPPYWPWAEALRELDASGAGSSLLELLPDTEGGSGARSRVHVYDAIARALAERAAHRPLVIILDDLQWADAASLELFRRVAAAARHAPLCVAATYRDIEVRINHPLTATLGALAREAVVDRIPVVGLAPSAVIEFIAHASGSRPTDDVAANVHRRTDGNPFFVSELVRLLEHDAGSEILATAVPLGVRDVIARRVAAMRGPARDLIGAAAVLGRTFDLATLASVTGLDVDSVVAELEPAVTGGLVALGTGAGRWRFRHDLVRETLYDSMSPVRRVRLHAHVADALSQAQPNDDDDVLAELAHHYWHGAAVLRAERAVPHILRAAQRADDRLAYERAEQLYAHAAELLDTMPTDEETLALRLRAAVRLVDLRRIRFGHAAPALGEALVAHDLAVETDASEQLLHVLWGLRSYHTARAEFDVAEHVASRLIELADRTDDPLVRAAGHQSLGAIAMHRGDATTASHHFELADRCVAERKTVSALAVEIAVYTPYLHAMALSGAGRFDDAQHLAEVGMARARDVGHPYLLTYAHATEAWLGTYRDDLDHVSEHSAAQQALAEEHGFQLHSGYAAFTGGWARARQGSPEEGEVMIETAIRDWEASGYRLLLPYVLGLLAEAQLLAGRPGEAAATLERARRVGDATGEHVQDLLLERVAGRIAVVRG